MSYKTRYLQSCFNTLTYELHNLQRLRKFEVSKSKRRSYRLTYHQRKKILRAEKAIEEARRLLKTFKGIEE